MNTNPTNARDYAEDLASYMAAVRQTRAGKSTDELRLEVQLECLCDWSQLHTLDQVKAWFQEQRRACTMEVESIPLSECSGWEYDEESGWLKHESGDFFYVQGVRASRTENREVGVGGWDQPILTQVGYDGGILGLLRRRINGVPHYLIEAKAEPGNYRLVQMSPTVQATYSNLKRAHKGRAPLFARMFEQPEKNNATVLYRQWLSEDGGRLYRKRNLGMLIEIPESTQIELPQSFIWMSMFQIKECLREDSWVNPHVRGIIAHL